MVTFVNPAAVALLGYDELELLGADAHALVHRHRPDGAPCPAQDCEDLRLIRSGNIVGRETFLCRERGTTFPTRFSSGRLERIFDQYARGAAAGVAPGAGLGLEIVRSVVERHGGSVWAEGAAGGGAMFRVSLHGCEPGAVEAVTRDGTPGAVP